MLALRLAVCNERWQEMWQKALYQVLSQQALKRAAHRRLQVPSAPAGAPSSSPAPVLQVSRPRSSQPSQRRKRHLARNRMRYSPPPSGEMRASVCSCGAPLARFKGHRPKQYCSNRCRKLAYRKRSSALPSRDSLPQKLKDQALCEPRQVLIRCSSRPAISVSADACPCEAPRVASARAPNQRVLLNSLPDAGSTCGDMRRDHETKDGLLSRCRSPPACCCRGDVSET
jgi:hypothetical protein